MKYLAAVLLCGWSMLLSAEPVKGLYDVAVPVDSQSSRSLARAAAEGLQTVFVRVSGNSAVLQQPAIRAAIQKARAFTRKFAYEKQAQDDGGEQLWLLVEFEPELIDQTLRDAGQPLWSSNRPTVLVWLVVEDLQGRRSVGVERDRELIEQLSQQAQRRGLAVRFPALDLEDMVAVSVDELWQLGNRKASAAAERYRTDTVLLGRVNQLSNGQWLGRWRYDYLQRVMELEGEALDFEGFAGQAMDQVAELLAAEYAIAPVKISEAGVLMRLTGVNSFVDYARAIRYLESVAAIRHANVVNIENDELIVRLVADGTLSQLHQAFELGRKLQVQTGAAYQGDELVDLDYQWPSGSSAAAAQ